MNLPYKVILVILCSLSLVTEAKNNLSLSKNITFFDKDRNRRIPVVIYFSEKQNNIKSPIIIINHGYDIDHTEYSFLGRYLGNLGYYVVSIQHELPSDVVLPETGSLYEQRKPLWEKGVKNILFVLNELKVIKHDLDFTDISLIGHSHGGNIVMFFATHKPNLITSVISLDSTLMLFPRISKPRILSLRSNDLKANYGVIPSPEEQAKFGIKIVKLDDALHMDFCDRGPIEIKTKINELISKFLDDKLDKF